MREVDLATFGSVENYHAYIACLKADYKVLKEQLVSVEDQLWLAGINEVDLDKELWG